MRKSLSLRLFSALAAFAQLGSSWADCGGEKSAVFNQAYAMSASSSQNCTAEIDTALSLGSYLYSGSEIGSVITAAMKESLQTNGYNSSTQLVGNVTQQDFNFGCMNIDSYPVFFNLSISLFAASEVAMQLCIQEYQKSGLPNFQDVLLKELGKLARRENEEQARFTLYLFLALCGSTLLILMSVILYFKQQRRQPRPVSSSGYGTFDNVLELNNLAEQNKQASKYSGTDDGVYELSLNTV